MLDIHNDINEKLGNFLNSGKIPNIIFHGPNGAGKLTLLSSFIDNIYNNDKNLINNYVLYANCAQGKGIKFIREDLKFFAKTNISSNIFKSIILRNADKLTMDAQSALRRCIELFTHSTRFFIIVEDKYKLLKPILSRFCEIYIDLPLINNKRVNLYKHYNDISATKSLKQTRYNWLKTCILKVKSASTTTNMDIFSLADKLYERSYSCLDIANYIEQNISDDLYEFEVLIYFNKMKSEIREERIMIYSILMLYILRLEPDLENITII